MKRRGAIVIIGIVVLILGCTILSARNYYESRAEVLLTSTVSNSIRVELEVVGEIFYKDILEVEIPSGCRVEEIMIESGESVNVGSSLLRLNEADLQIAYYQKLLQFEELQETERLGGTEGALAGWKIQLLSEEIELLKSIIDNGGQIAASKAGQVILQEYKLGDKTGEESRLKIGSTEAGCYLEWQIDADKYRKFTTITATVEGENTKLTIKDPIYTNGKYTYKVDIPERKICIHGSPVKITLRYISEEYGAVLPINCIWYDDDGSTYVYEIGKRKRNFGEEYYARKVGVTIEEQDRTNAAIKSPLSDVIIRSSKKLEDMMPVVIIEE